MPRRKCYSGSRDGGADHRKGTVLVLFATMLTAMCGMVAMAVDTGALACYRGQAQNAADAAALAAAWEMASPDHMHSEPSVKQAAGYLKAVEYASRNHVGQAMPVLLPTQFSVGTLSDPHNPAEEMNTLNPDDYNSVQVTISQEAPLFFAAIFGMRSSTIQTQATASFFSQHTVGFKVTGKTGPSSLMPFAVKRTDYEAMVASGEGATMKMYPSDKTAPGNFGLVEIGSQGGGATDPKRQITDGPSQEDLAEHGEDGLVLDSVTGTLEIFGDPGLKTSIKDSVDIVLKSGVPRTILLYDSVDDTGQNAVYTISGFAGVKLLSAKLTGNNKEIIIEAAVVADNTAVTENFGTTSYFVGSPVSLVR